MAVSVQGRASAAGWEGAGTSVLVVGVVDVVASGGLMSGAASGGGVVVSGPVVVVTFGSASGAASSVSSGVTAGVVSGSVPLVTEVCSPDTTLIADGSGSRCSVSAPTGLSGIRSPGAGSTAPGSPAGPPP